jgi:hypothetical protein
VSWEMVIDLSPACWFFGFINSAGADDLAGGNAHPSLGDSESLDFDVNMDESDLGC